MIDAFTVPPKAWRAAAMREPATLAVHDALSAAAEASSLRQVRVGAGKGSAHPAARVEVAAWNVERGRSVEAIAKVLGRAGIQIALLTEVDIGMARSGNRDTVAEIAALCGVHHVTAVEFIELGLGDPRETQVYAGVDNAIGLHGNAVLSQWPIKAAAIIRLDDGGFWFADQPDPSQRRIGARNAIAALIDAGFGDVWWVAAHFESHKEAADRGAEMSRLCNGLDDLRPAAPVVLGGDFNAKGIDGAVLAAGDLAPEPLFDVAERRGLSIAGVNTAETTARRRSWHEGDFPLRRLDWLVVRGLNGARPRTHPALDEEGRDISDHDMVSAEVFR